MEERIIDRLTEFIKVRGYNDSFICQSCNLSSGLLTLCRKPDKDLSIRTVKKIVAQFPELNEEWLLDGTGKMLHSSFSEDSETILSGNIIKRLDLLLKEEDTNIRCLLSNDIKAKKKYIQAHDSPTKEKALYWANILLEKFPDYSWDWVMNGTGPAKTFKGKYWIPVLDKEQIVSVWSGNNIASDTRTQYCYLKETPSVDFLYKVKEGDYAPKGFIDHCLGCSFRAINCDGWVWGGHYLLITADGVNIGTFAGIEYGIVLVFKDESENIQQTQIRRKDILCAARIDSYMKTNELCPIRTLKP